MDPILNLSPQQFRAALAELALDPAREADLVRQYRRANSPLAPVFGLLERVAGRDAGQGMQRASMVPVARPEGMSVAEAVRSGEARLAVPQGVLDAIGALAGGIDAPGAAARGLIPVQDMPAEALGTAGVAMGGGGLLSRPAGSVGMGGRMLSSDDVLNAADDDFVTLYHGTTREAADKIRQSGRLQSAGEPSVYLTTDPTGGGYGDGTVVPVRVRRGLLEIDDEFPSGRADFRIDLDRPGGSVRVEIPETPAQRVAGLLREGRASEVTDDLMAQADPQEMYRLYVAGETGADMPMDEASRMARAAEMGFSTDAGVYHATTSDFPAVDLDRAGAGMSMGTGERAFWTTTRPKTAETYLPGAYVAKGNGGAPMGGGVERYYNPQSSIMPMLAKTDNVDLWQVGGGGYPQGGLGADIAEAAAAGRDAAVFRNMRDPGIMGLGSGDRTNTSIATINPAAIRSRFARFDPRLSHLANLNAANVDPITGAAAVTASQQDDPLANLRAYISASGGILPR